MKWFVYVIWARDEDGEEVRYYGHTKNMKSRLKHHRNSHKTWVQKGRPKNITDAARRCCTSVRVLDMGDWNLDILHDLECDKKEARRVEQNYIQNNDCVNHYGRGGPHPSTRINCDCGAVVCIYNIKAHLKTKKHAKRMQQSTSS